MSKSLHSLKAKDLKGKDVDLKDYAGKVVMVVNIASKCGLTPQLEGLEKIYEKYRPQGFEILAFPSNQFAGQEPLEGDAINEFCSINYGASFRIMEKTEVKGVKAHPVFKFLSNKSENGKVNLAPMWNFQKYIIDKNGMVRDYFLPVTTPESDKVTGTIEKLLAE
jgi:glutathione peroxidase